MVQNRGIDTTVGISMRQHICIDVCCHIGLAYGMSTHCGVVNMLLVMQAMHQRICIDIIMSTLIDTCVSLSL